MFPGPVVALALCAVGYASAQQIALPAALAYTPLSAPCPANFTLVRSAGKHATLSHQETAYISTRQKKVLPGAWSSYLSAVEHSARTQHIALPHYLTAILEGRAEFPTLGIATSGGGMRAALFGGTVLNTLDGRNSTSVSAGVGGLLQAASYLAGLSGGSFLVTSLVQANFPTIPSLIFGLDAGAGTGEDVFGGWLNELGLTSISTNATVQTEFIELLLEEIAGKHAAGFPITFTDVFSRSLARHFVNGTTLADFFSTNFTHGAGITWSGVANLSTFENHEMPFPIIVTDSVSQFENDKAVIPGNDVPLTNPIYEFNVFETGSFDPMLSSFVPTLLLGSRNRTCVSNFDQVSFVSASSSNLWNEFNVSAAALAASSIGPVVAAINATFPQPGLRLDTAAIPNPFQGVAPKTFLDRNQTIISFVDGGEDGEVVPIQPMLVKSRGVDIVIAIDASADTENNWTNGSSIISTQERAALFPGVYSFPPIPTSPNVFEARNLTRHTTFFGCDTNHEAPLVVYIANGGPPLGQPPLTNLSTFTDTFTTPQIQAFMNQAFDVATQGIPISSTHKDPEFPACLACAVVDRARARIGERRSGVCSTCLQRYCFS
ncbi:lysophospholipase [Phanerochaete sordida]|uniref:Lysophospholipase n=1 Tax=Phanerochaete sordida TaxID=48140 RepID=A0A9P3G383_9APHY|nr:lysophospholipase [Phanerochaete sordida]